jgi:hypothetical protein
MGRSAKTQEGKGSALSGIRAEFSPVDFRRKRKRRRKKKICRQWTKGEMVKRYTLITSGGITNGSFPVDNM